MKGYDLTKYCEFTLNYEGDLRITLQGELYHNGTMIAKRKDNALVRLKTNSI
jgi:hypothetical protein